MPKRVDVQSVERVYDGFMKLDQAEFTYEKYDGSMSAPTRRLVLERGDSVGILIYERTQRRVGLVQQFRFPAYVRNGPGWLWEIIAGVVDRGREPEEVARSEAEEEAGYRLEALRQVLTFFPSPGGSSERIYLYLASTPELAAEGVHGVKREGEDILMHSFSLEEALRMIDGGQIMDAKTIIALQYLARHWDDLD